MAFHPGRFTIDSYGAGGFRFAGMSHRGSILALPSGIHDWDGVNLSAVLAERADIDLLIVGTGPTMARLPPPVREEIESTGMMLDCMATGHAVATYNLLLGEKRKVAAALVAVEQPV